MDQDDDNDWFLLVSVDELGTPGLWASVKDLLESRSVLQHLTVHNKLGRAVAVERLQLQFVASNDKRLQRLRPYARSPVVWFRHPYAHILLVATADASEYRSVVKPALRRAIADLEHDWGGPPAPASPALPPSGMGALLGGGSSAPATPAGVLGAEWLIVYVRPADLDLTDKAAKKVYDKLKDDFSTRGRTRVIRIDAPKGYSAAALAAVGTSGMIGSAAAAASGSAWATPRGVAPSAGGVTGVGGAVVGAGVMGGPMSMLLPGNVLGLEDLEQCLRECVRASFESRQAAYMAEVQRLANERRDPNWNFSSLYLVKDTLARLLEGFGLNVDAYKEYVELEAAYQETLDRRTAQQAGAGAGAAAAGAGAGAADEGPEDLYGAADDGADVATLTSASWRATRRSTLKRSAVQEFKFRQYLFAAQSRLLLRLGRPVDVAERGLRFIGATAAELGRRERAAGGGVRPLLKEAWTFSACLAVITAVTASVFGRDPLGPPGGVGAHGGSGGVAPGAPLAPPGSLWEAADGGGAAEAAAGESAASAAAWAGRAGASDAAGPATAGTPTAAAAAARGAGGAGGQGGGAAGRRGPHVLDPDQPPADSSEAPSGAGLATAAGGTGTAAALVSEAAAAAAVGWQLWSPFEAEVPVVDLIALCGQAITPAALAATKPSDPETALRQATFQAFMLALAHLYNTARCALLQLASKAAKAAKTGLDGALASANASAAGASASFASAHPFAFTTADDAPSRGYEEDDGLSSAPWAVLDDGEDEETLPGEVEWTAALAAWRQGLRELASKYPCRMVVGMFVDQEEDRQFEATPQQQATQLQLLRQALSALSAVGLGGVVAAGGGVGGGGGGVPPAPQSPARVRPGGTATPTPRGDGSPVVANSTIWLTPPGVSAPPSIHQDGPPSLVSRGHHRRGESMYSLNITGGAPGTSGASVSGVSVASFAPTAAAGGTDPWDSATSISRPAGAGALPYGSRTRGQAQVSFVADAAGSGGEVGGALLQPSGGSLGALRGEEAAAAAAAGVGGGAGAEGWMSPTQSARSLHQHSSSADNAGGSVLASFEGGGIVAAAAAGKGLARSSLTQLGPTAGAAPQPPTAGLSDLTISARGATPLAPGPYPTTATTTAAGAPAGAAGHAAAPGAVGLGGAEALALLLPPVVSWLRDWRLRLALSSPGQCANLALQLALTTATCYSRAGRQRSAALLFGDVGSVLLSRGQAEVVAELMDGVVKVADTEGWLALLGRSLPVLMAAQQAIGHVMLPYTCMRYLSLPQQVCQPKVRRLVLQYVVTSACGSPVLGESLGGAGLGGAGLLPRPRRMPAAAAVLQLSTMSAIQAALVPGSTSKFFGTPDPSGQPSLVPPARRHPPASPADPHLATRHASHRISARHGKTAEPRDDSDQNQNHDTQRQYHNKHQNQQQQQQQQQQGNKASWGSGPGGGGGSAQLLRVGEVCSLTLQILSNLPEPVALSDVHLVLASLLLPPPGSNYHHHHSHHQGHLAGGPQAQQGSSHYPQVLPQQGPQITPPPGPQHQQQQQQPQPQQTGPQAGPVGTAAGIAGTSGRPHTAGAAAPGPSPAQQYPQLSRPVQSSFSTAQPATQHSGSHHHHHRNLSGGDVTALAAAAAAPPPPWRGGGPPLPSGGPQYPAVPPSAPSSVTGVPPAPRGGLGGTGVDLVAASAGGGNTSSDGWAGPRPPPPYMAPPATGYPGYGPWGGPQPGHQYPGTHHQHHSSHPGIAPSTLSHIGSSASVSGVPATGGGGGAGAVGASAAVQLASTAPASPTVPPPSGITGGGTGGMAPSRLAVTRGSAAVGLERHVSSTSSTLSLGPTGGASAAGLGLASFSHLSESSGLGRRAPSWPDALSAAASYVQTGPGSVAWAPHGGSKAGGGGSDLEVVVPASSGGGLTSPGSHHAGGGGWAAGDDLVAYHVVEVRHVKTQPDEPTIASSEGRKGDPAHTHTKPLAASPARGHASAAAAPMPSASPVQRGAEGWAGGGGGGGGAIDPRVIILRPGLTQLTFRVAPNKPGLYFVRHVAASLGSYDLRIPVVHADQLTADVAALSSGWSASGAGGSGAGGGEGGTAAAGTGSVDASGRTGSVTKDCGGRGAVGSFSFGTLGNGGVASGTAAALARLGRVADGEVRHLDVVLQVAPLVPRLLSAPVVVGGSLTAGLPQWLGVALNPLDTDLHLGDIAGVRGAGGGGSRGGGGEDEDAGAGSDGGVSGGGRGGLQYARVHVQARVQAALRLGDWPPPPASTPAAPLSGMPSLASAGGAPLPPTPTTAAGSTLLPPPHDLPSGAADPSAGALLASSSVTALPGVISLGLGGGAFATSAAAAAYLHQPTPQPTASAAFRRTEAAGLCRVAVVDLRRAVRQEGGRSAGPGTSAAPAGRERGTEGGSTVAAPVAAPASAAAGVGGGGAGVSWTYGSRQGIDLSQSLSGPLCSPVLLWLPVWVPPAVAAAAAAGPDDKPSSSLSDPVPPEVVRVQQAHGGVASSRHPVSYSSGVGRRSCGRIGQPHSTSHNGRDPLLPGGGGRTAGQRALPPLDLEVVVEGLQGGVWRSFAASLAVPRQQPFRVRTTAHQLPDNRVLVSTTFTSNLALPVVIAEVALEPQYGLVLAAAGGGVGGAEGGAAAAAGSTPTAAAGGGGGGGGGGGVLSAIPGLLPLHVAPRETVSWAFMMSRVADALPPVPGLHPDDCCVLHVSYHVVPGAASPAASPEEVLGPALQPVSGYRYPLPPLAADGMPHDGTIPSSFGAPGVGGLSASWTHGSASIKGGAAFGLGGLGGGPCGTAGTWAHSPTLTHGAPPSASPAGVVTAQPSCPNIYSHTGAYTAAIGTGNRPTYDGTTASVVGSGGGAVSIPGGMGVGGGAGGSNNLIFSHGFLLEFPASNALTHNLVSVRLLGPYNAVLGQPVHLTWLITRVSTPPASSAATITGIGADDGMAGSDVAVYEVAEVPEALEAGTSGPGASGSLFGLGVIGGSAATAGGAAGGGCSSQWRQAVGCRGSIRLGRARGSVAVVEAVVAPLATGLLHAPVLRLRGLREVKDEEVPGVEFVGVTTS